MNFHKIPLATFRELELERVMVKQFSKLSYSSSITAVKRYFKLRKEWKKLKCARTWSNGSVDFLPDPEVF